MYRQRFGLTGYPLPKNAQGKTFFDKSPGFKKLERAFRQLIADPGLGVLTADAGVGKTAALRHLCLQLPKPDYLVLYLCAAVYGETDGYLTNSPPSVVKLTAFGIAQGSEILERFGINL